MPLTSQPPCCNSSSAVWRPIVPLTPAMSACLVIVNFPPRDRIVTLVRPRGLEPPRCYPLAPQASASTNSATAAWMKVDGCLTTAPRNIDPSHAPLLTPLSWPGEDPASPVAGTDHRV